MIKTVTIATATASHSGANRDEVFRPIHLGRNDHRLHADIVHGADRHAEHGAARGHGAETKRRREAKPGDRHGGADRDQRQADIVADGEAGLEGEHGDEMGRPNAAAKDNRRRE
jgi:hypothetical protein